jgi:hypothetical protein
MAIGAKNEKGRRQTAAALSNNMNLNKRGKQAACRYFTDPRPPFY